MNTVFQSCCEALSGGTELLGGKLQPINYTDKFSACPSRRSLSGPVK